MWRDEARVRARMAEVERATRQTRRIRGDALPPPRGRGPRVRRTVARVARAVASFALALAGTLDASVELGGADSEDGRDRPSGPSLGLSG